MSILYLVTKKYFLDLLNLIYKPLVQLNNSALCLNLVNYFLQCLGAFSKSHSKEKTFQ